MHDQLMSRTRQLIAGCPCDNGCPSCVGPVGETGPLAKTVALRILAHLSHERDNHITAGAGSVAGSLDEMPF